MQLNFGNSELEQLYTKGQSRKYKFPKDIVKRYIMRINTISAATTIYDFWNDPTLNFERLQGLEDVFSMRINIKYRLIISIDFADVDKTYGTVIIEDITNHYT
jgi:toxin HigB-1